MSSLRKTLLTPTGKFKYGMEADLEILFLESVLLDVELPLLILVYFL